MKNLTPATTIASGGKSFEGFVVELGTNAFFVARDVGPEHEHRFRGNCMGVLDENGKPLGLMNVFLVKDVLPAFQEFVRMFSDEA